MTDIGFLAGEQGVNVHKKADMYNKICIQIRGVTVHKMHGSVRYDTVVSRFGTFSIQQKERNSREIELILFFYFEFEQ